MIEAPESTALPPPPTTDTEAVALRTIGLVKHYGRVRVVNGLDLEVPRGKIYGFLGRNGAGKTTTIRMLMGILKPKAGEIEFFGQRTRRTTTALKQRIGYVSQSQHFYPWMSARQLGRFVSGFYPAWDGAEYDRLLGLLEIPRDRRSSQLSGGMRMKLALALALAHHPELLILDEPTAGLDPVAQREFLEIVKNQSRNHGRTTLFSTHRIDEVERAADKVGIIDSGVMRYEGDLDELRSEVRRVTVPSTMTEAPFAGREGHELLREETLPEVRRYTYRCVSPAAWSLPMPSDWHVERLSLEDIFLAYAGMKVADL